MTVLSDCWNGDITYENGEDSKRNKCTHTPVSEVRQSELKSPVVNVSSGRYLSDFQWRCCGMGDA